MIYLNGQQLNAIGGLSTKSQAVLAMITGGQKWLSMCIVDTTITSINVESENQLLKLIQSGLTGDNYIRFNTFRADIDKILSLSDADTAQLAAIRLSANDNEANLAVLLHQNGMLSYGDLAKSADLISQLVQKRPDLFQAISFNDMLTLADFTMQQSEVDPDLQTQSAAFASTSAATVSDFVNLSLFFQYAQQHLQGENLIPQTQNSEIQAMYVQLAAVVQPYLFTPSIDMKTAGGNMVQSVPDLARGSNFIGYITASSAMLNLIQNISLNDQTGGGLTTAINNYLAAVKNLISFTPVTTNVLSQDGATASLKFQSNQGIANVGVDRNGTVYLFPDTKIIHLN
jgi:hypothetical protein